MDDCFVYFGNGAGGTGTISICGFHSSMGLNHALGDEEAEGSIDYCRDTWLHIFSAGECFPVEITSIFISNSPEVFAAAPRIFRLFFPIFLFVGVVVIADYYLQSIMEERQSILLGLMHSAILSGLFCMILPLFSGMTGVWLALPLADLITASMGIFFYEEFKKVGIFTMMNSKEKKVAHLWWEEENDHS